MNGRLGVGLLALLLVASVAAPASAWDVYRPLRTWNSPPQVVVSSAGLSSVNDGNRGVTRIVNAIVSSQAWNGEGTGTRLTAVSGYAGLQRGDGIPMVVFTDPYSDCTGGCLAATYITYHTSAAIYDADIITNLNPYASGISYSWTSLGEDTTSSCYREFFVEPVMVHEVGHLLGIAHTTVSSATMYPYIGSCNTSFLSTESDDAQSLNYLYGRGFLALFEGNNGTQDRECDLSAVRQTVKFQSSGSPCSNDETRSLRIKHVKAGFRARVYDDPNCGTGDDWTEIHVKQNVEQHLVGTFESSSDNGSVRVTHHHDNGLDGKISCFRSTYCGDGYCELGESCSSCSTDCGTCPYCGDGMCNGGESCSTCSTDCGSCGGCDYDGWCETGEAEWCGDCCPQEPYSNLLGLPVQCPV